MLRVSISIGTVAQIGKLLSDDAGESRPHNSSNNGLFGHGTCEQVDVIQITKLRRKIETQLGILAAIS